MVRGLNNSNYVVFGLVLLVLVMGVISSVSAETQYERTQRMIAECLNDGGYVNDAGFCVMPNQMTAEECLAQGGVYSYVNEACVELPGRQQPANAQQPENYVAHTLDQIVNAQGETVDANGNNIVDVADSATLADRATIADRVTLADRVENADAADHLDLALANIILDGVTRAGMECSSNAECGSLICQGAVAVRTECRTKQGSVSNDPICGHICHRLRDGSVDGCPNTFNCVGAIPPMCRMQGAKEICEPGEPGRCGMTTISGQLGKCVLLANQISV